MCVCVCVCVSVCVCVPQILICVSLLFMNHLILTTGIAHSPRHQFRWIPYLANFLCTAHSPVRTLMRYDFALLTIIKPYTPSIVFIYAYVVI